MGPCTAYEYLANNEALRGLFLARQRRKGPDRVEPGPAMACQTIAPGSPIDSAPFWT